MRFRVLHYDTLDSTNNLARDFAEDGASEGTVIVAEYQTHGRGRFNRRWYAPRGGGLLASIILRPCLRAVSAPMLTHIAASSVREAIRKRFRLNAQLKRPNDVLVGEKKIAGILTEATIRGSQLAFVVVGIGLNVNVKAKNLMSGATSIYQETKVRADKNAILRDLLDTFDRWYQALNHR